MKISDLVIIAICGALGFGVMRNILGTSKPSDDSGPPADSDED